MKQELYDALMDNPIIAAVKDEEGLEASIRYEDMKVVFLLFGDVCSISDLVKKAKDGGKIVFVHMDLLTGLSGKPEAVDFVAKYTEADGIISTRIEQVRRGKELSLSTIYRIFVLDSRVIDKVNPKLGECADIVEILPGIMPKITKKMSKLLPVPVIAGGLISEKADVVAALKSGAIAISATSQSVWQM